MNDDYQLTLSFEGYATGAISSIDFLAMLMAISRTTGQKFTVYAVCQGSICEYVIDQTSEFVRKDYYTVGYSWFIHFGKNCDGYDPETSLIDWNVQVPGQEFGGYNRNQLFFFEMDAQNYANALNADEEYQAALQKHWRACSVMDNFWDDDDFWDRYDEDCDQDYFDCCRFD